MFNGIFPATLLCFHSHVSAFVLMLIRVGFTIFTTPRDSHYPRSSPSTSPHTNLHHPPTRVLIPDPPFRSDPGETTVPWRRRRRHSSPNDELVDLLQYEELYIVLSCLREGSRKRRIGNPKTKTKTNVKTKKKMKMKTKNKMKTERGRNKDERHEIGRWGSRLEKAGLRRHTLTARGPCEDICVSI